MADPFMSMISMTGFNWAPEKFALCDGTVMHISEHAALYALIGNVFGGNGQTTFDLPDLRGRTPVGLGQWDESYTRGKKGGAPDVTLNTSHLPAHTHDVKCQSNVRQTALANPENRTYAPTFNESLAYTASLSNYVALHPAALPTQTGGSAAHNNMQPYLAINFIIAISGAFPARD